MLCHQMPTHCRVAQCRDETCTRRAMGARGKWRERASFVRWRTSFVFISSRGDGEDKREPNHPKKDQQRSLIATWVVQTNLLHALVSDRNSGCLVVAYPPRSTAPVGSNSHSPISGALVAATPSSSTSSSVPATPAAAVATAATAPPATVPTTSTTAAVVVTHGCKRFRGCKQERWCCGNGSLPAGSSIGVTANESTGSWGRGDFTVFSSRCLACFVVRNRFHLDSRSGKLYLSWATPCYSRCYCRCAERAGGRRRYLTVEVDPGQASCGV